MELTKTVDNNGYIRIEEECGAAITLSHDKDTADILSIYIPEDKRREGLGYSLLSAAKQEAYKHDVRKIGANFSDRISGMQKLFEKSGFEVYDGAPIFSIDTEKLLGSKKVINSLKKKTDKADFVSLDNLKLSQWDDFFSVLKKSSIKLNPKDVAAFSKKISGVVYDKDGAIRAYVFCSEGEGQVHIDYLGTPKKGDGAYAMEALKGMVNNIILSGGDKTYPELTAVCANDNATKLMEKVLPEDPKRTGMALFAQKELNEESLKEIEIYDQVDKDIYYEWDREIAKVPMQANIGLKTTLYRDKNN